MWKQLVDFGNKLFSLMHRVHNLEGDHTSLRQELTAVRQDIKDLNEEVHQLSTALQRLAFEFQRDRENAERDREIQRLRLENMILRAVRALPPGSRSESEDES